MNQKSYYLFVTIASTIYSILFFVASYFIISFRELIYLFDYILLLGFASNLIFLFFHRFFFKKILWSSFFIYNSLYILIFVFASFRNINFFIIAIAYMSSCLLALYNLRLLDRHRILSFSFSILCICFFIYAAPATNNLLLIWKKPPQTSHLRERLIDYEFKTLEGRVISSDSLKSKIAIIECWATWCKPCIALFPQYQKLYNKYKNNPNIVFLSTNVDAKKDDVKKIRTFVEKRNLLFPVYRDTTDNFLTTLKINSIPATIIVKDGYIREAFIGLKEGQDYQVEVEMVLKKLLK